MLEIYAASAKAGLIMVPINFRLLGGDIEYIVENSEAKAFIVQHDLIDRVEGIRSSRDAGDLRPVPVEPMPALRPARRFSCVSAPARQTRAAPRYRQPYHFWPEPREFLLAPAERANPTVKIGQAWNT